MSATLNFNISKDLSRLYSICLFIGRSEPFLAIEKRYMMTVIWLAGIVQMTMTTFSTYLLFSSTAQKWSFAPPLPRCTAPVSVCGQTTSSRGQQPSPETQVWDLQPTQATAQTPGESLTLYLSEAAVVEHYFESGKRLESWQGSRP